MTCVSTNVEAAEKTDKQQRQDGKDQNAMLFHHFAATSLVDCRSRNCYNQLYYTRCFPFGQVRRYDIEVVL
jgi:hypothetical protein